ncbi:hypothetical protein BZK31_22035 [Pseudomonas floridensis]|uniref:histidine kinase n=1 Tax=Pseudomonas floridensis TaxID=1958950 RepID=A0A1X0N2H0_9PSED|nr:ATP-binding protein [Pseudomonas floridensis]ORC56878.1 hypothetical protein BZK31_22035 [Pseudomonas floridensis]
MPAPMPPIQASTPTGYAADYHRTPITLPPQIQQRIDRLRILLVGLVLLTGFTVLAGYAFDVPRLITLTPTLQGMSPLTALGIILISVTLVVPVQRRYALWPCILMTSAIAISTMTSQWLLRHDVMSERVVTWFFSTSVTGQTSFATGLCLGLLAMAQAARLAGSLRVSDLLSSIALATSGIAVLGYAYEVEELYKIFFFNTIALHTACALNLLALATLIRNCPGGYASILFTDQSAGRVTRIQTLLACSIPVIGLLLSQATHVSQMGAEAALAIAISITFLPLVVLIIRNGRALSRLDEARRKGSEDEARIKASLEAELADKLVELEEQTRQRKEAQDVINRTQRLEAVGQLTGGIAHDFNNLLMAIAGNLELLQRTVPADTKSHAYASRALTATQKGTRLTGQLLAFSRTQKLTLEELSLAPVMQSVKNLIANALGLNIDVSITPPDDSLWVRSDSHQLELAILNLALNAKDAMPEGGSLTIQCRAVGPSAGRAAMVAISVTDTGSGMSPEIAAKATEPFFTTKEHGQGTGLGLAQVYGFCLQCNGDLVIHSTLGIGTRVEILLPQVEAREPDITDDGVVKVRRREETNRQILVVDDDESVRSVFVDALRLDGFDVIEATDGFSALRILNEIRPAAAVIDFLMPGLNGADLARKARLRQPDLPIVFISGYSDTLALDSISDAVVLRKPIDLQALSAVVTDMTRSA